VRDPAVARRPGSTGQASTADPNIGIMILLALTAVFLTTLGIHVFAPGIV
jgi:hypothetical protein